MPKIKKSLKQHRLDVNTARRERAAAKRAAAKPTKAAAAAADTIIDKAAKDVADVLEGKNKKAAVVKYMAARATDRGAHVLQEIDNNLTDSEVVAELLAGGKVNIYDVVYIFAFAAGETAGTLTRNPIVVIPLLMVV